MAPLGCSQRRVDGGYDIEEGKRMIKTLRETLGDRASPEIIKSYEAVMRGEPPSFGFPKGWAFAIDMSPTDPNTLIAATRDLAIVSSDGGESWLLCRDLVGSRSAAIHPTDKKIMAVGGTASIWLTQDGGVTWCEVTNGLVRAGTVKKPGGPHPGHVVFDPKGERLFALTPEGIWVAEVAALCKMTAP